MDFVQSGAAAAAGYQKIIDKLEGRKKKLCEFQRVVIGGDGHDGGDGNDGANQAMSASDLRKELKSRGLCDADIDAAYAKFVNVNGAEKRNDDGPDKNGGDGGKGNDSDGAVEEELHNLG